VAGSRRKISPSGLGLLPAGFPTKEETDELLQIAKKVYQEIIENLLQKNR